MTRAAMPRGMPKALPSSAAGVRCRCRPRQRADQLTPFSASAMAAARETLCEPLATPPALLQQRPSRHSQWQPPPPPPVPRAHRHHRLRRVRRLRRSQTGGPPPPRRPPQRASCRRAAGWAHRVPRDAGATTVPGSAAPPRPRSPPPRRSRTHGCSSSTNKVERKSKWDDTRRGKVSE